MPMMEEVELRRRYWEKIRLQFPRLPFPTVLRPDLGSVTKIPRTPTLLWLWPRMSQPGLCRSSSS